MKDLENDMETLYFHPAIDELYLGLTYNYHPLARFQGLRRFVMGQNQICELNQGFERSYLHPF